MRGLLLKDFYTLKQYGKSLAFLLVFFCILSAGMENPPVFFQGFFVLMAMTMTIYSFSYDMLAKWDRYALSLPVTRKEIVTSKYLLAVIVTAGGTLISFLFTCAILLIKPVEDYGFREHLLATAVIFGFALFFAGILLPLIFKFGVEKARIFMFAVFAIPSVAVVLIDQLGLPKPTDGAFLNFFKLAPIVMIAFFLLSYLVSIKIFKSKEF